MAAMLAGNCGRSKSRTSCPCEAQSNATAVPPAPAPNTAIFIESLLEQPQTLLPSPCPTSQSRWALDDIAADFAVKGTVRFHDSLPIAHPNSAGTEAGRKGGRRGPPLQHYGCQCVGASRRREAPEEIVEDGVAVPLDLLAGPQDERLVTQLGLFRLRCRSEVPPRLFPFQVEHVLVLHGLLGQEHDRTQPIGDERVVRQVLAG